MFAACASSPEDKANAMIQESMKKTLFFPESYKPVSTVVDSAFAPYDDPAFYEKTLRVVKLGVALQKLEEKAKWAKREVGMYTDNLRIMYSNADKVRLNQAKEEYQKYVNEIDKITKKAQKLGQELKAEMEKKPQFIGFKAKHTYNAQNNAGQTIGGSAVFIFNKDMNQIIGGYDTDTDEYKVVMLFYKQLRGEDITGEDIDMTSI